MPDNLFNLLCLFWTDSAAGTRRKAGKSTLYRHHELAQLFGTDSPAFDKAVAYVRAHDRFSEIEKVAQTLTPPTLGKLVAVNQHGESCTIDLDQTIHLTPLPKHFGWFYAAGPAGNYMIRINRPRTSVVALKIIPKQSPRHANTKYYDLPDGRSFTEPLWIRRSPIHEDPHALITPARLALENSCGGHSRGEHSSGGQ